MGIYWGEAIVDVRPVKPWHRHEHGGRHFRILIEPRERWETIDYVVVKIDWAVSEEEVRAVRFAGELSGMVESQALEAAYAVIARHVSGG